MNAKPHSPEWLIANADHGVAFERACASAMERMLTENANLQQQLEAIGAGGVGPLMPSKLTAQDIADSALLGNIESPFNACMHQEHCKRWKAQAGTAVEQKLRPGMVYALPAGDYVGVILRGRYYPLTTPQPLVAKQPQGEQGAGVLMPPRSLVDQVIRGITRYCNTGEMDDAESLLAELQFSIDPAQQPPTTEQSSAVDRPEPAYLLRDLADDIGVEALDLIVAIRDAGLGDYSINMMLPARVRVAMCRQFFAAPQPPAVEQPQGNQEPVAWLHTDRLGGKQAFTNEPPPGLKALCQPLVYATQEKDEQEPDAFYEWWNMRPSLTRLQAWLLWKDQAKAEGGAA